MSVQIRAKVAPVTMPICLQYWHQYSKKEINNVGMHILSMFFFHEYKYYASKSKIINGNC